MKLNAEVVNHRAKLLMSRLVARRLRRDTTLMEAACKEAQLQKLPIP